MERSRQLLGQDQSRLSWRALTTLFTHNLVIALPALSSARLDQLVRQTLVRAGFLGCYDASLRSKARPQFSVLTELIPPVVLIINFPIPSRLRPWTPSPHLQVTPDAKLPIK